MSATAYDELKSLLNELSHQQQAVNAQKFFKTGKGDYAEGDQFIGIAVPTLRKLAKQFANLPKVQLTKLLHSAINEERLLALLILVHQYQRGDETERKNIYDYYLRHIQRVNNWNLVDTSAHLIMGDYLHRKEKSILKHLAQSGNLWERRVAIVSTWHFIRNDDFAWTIKIARMLLNDPHDLIHKAVGWMLREVGKRDQKPLIDFLEKHHLCMPRTMLRYAIEKFPEKQRKIYLQGIK